jgi:TonB family protein
LAVAVDEILAERERRARSAPAVASLGAAALLHAAVLALIVLLPHLSPPPPPLDFVAVQVVPAQRLGGERPASRTVPEAPQPPPPARPAATPPPQPAPQDEPVPPPRSADAPVLPHPQQAAPPPPPKPQKPPKAAKPKPDLPDNRIDPTLVPKVLPPPREVLAQRLAREQAAAAPAAPAPGAPGAATGQVNAKAAVGSSVTAFDNPDFTYDYYIAQLVSLIDQNWIRPPVAAGVHAVLSFRIQRDGSIVGLTVRQSSGLDAFDLAAERAVTSVARFPPLPRAYTQNHDSVGVNVTLR